MTSSRPLLISALCLTGIECLAGIGSAWAAPARAQDTDVLIRQAPTDPAGRSTSIDVNQIASGPVRVATPPMADRSVEGSSAPASNPIPTSQIGNATSSVEAGPQLAPRDPSVGPSPPAAALAQGRVTAMATPAGLDRCDPQSRTRGAVACDRVIEARAGEFRAPEPQALSAEQQLLASQRDQRDAQMDVSAAARRLANGQIDDSTAALAVASLSFQPTGRPAEEEEAVVDTSAIDAIVAGITTLVTGQPPSP